MARKAKAQEESSGPPAWIVSFSDMVTLLLAFFVLLQSFAKVRDPELFFIGQGSFKRAIAGLGMPQWLFGRKDRPKRDFVNIKYPTEQGPEARPKERIIDADNEKIRQIFADLEKDFDVTASDVLQKQIRVEPTPIRFEGEQCVLDEQARKYLQQRVCEWKQTLAAGPVRICVVGLAADQTSRRQQWSVSARRAAAVRDHLVELLGAEADTRDWMVDSWGGGPGGPWCAEHGFMPARTAIVIAIMKESGPNG